MLTVLSLAYPLASVGQDAVGGAEQVLTVLDDALVRAGHRSIVVASEGSRTSDVLIATRQPAGLINTKARARAQAGYRAAIRYSLAQQGMVRLHVMRLADQTAAAFYGFSAKGRTSYYLGGFAPAFARYSPGTLVVDYAIQYAAAEHNNSFDFLRGREAYKCAWGATEQPLFSLTRLGSRGQPPEGLARAG